jgi:hypothetical protein
MKGVFRRKRRIRREERQKEGKQLGGRQCEEKERGKRVRRRKEHNTRLEMSNQRFSRLKILNTYVFKTKLRIESKRFRSVLKIVGTKCKDLFCFPHFLSQQKVPFRLLETYGINCN